MPLTEITRMDIPGLRDLQPPGWGDITDSFEMYLESGLFRPFKDEENGIIRGIANSTNYGKTAWLSHIIVHKAYRGRGIGSMMVSHLLKDLDLAGVETISLIATEAGRPVYLKAGFRDQGKYLIFTRDNVQPSVEISPFIEPYDESCKSAILKLDGEVAGENRSALIEKHLEKALVYVRKDHILGYYLPGLGEGSIAALNNEAGLALLDYKLLRDNRVVLPQENRRAVKFLLSRGFRKERITAMRMVRGKEFPWKPDCLYSRIGGKLG